VKVYRIGLSIIARDSDGDGSAAGVQLLITLFYESIPAVSNFGK
jgi:hypothetical protein